MEYQILGLNLLRWQIRYYGGHALRHLLVPYLNEKNISFYLLNPNTTGT